MPDAAAASLQLQWERAARTAIVQIHDRKKRAAEEARFDRLLARIPAPPPRELDARAFQRAAAQELSIPGRYRLEAVHPPPKSWLARVWEWISKRVYDLLHPLFQKIRIGKNGAAAVGDVLILAFVLIVAYTAARLLRSISIERDESATRLSALETRRNARALALRAAELAAQGNYGHAVRVLFGAAVTLLDLRGAITDDAAATVNQLRKELSARNGAASAPFGALARIFTSAAYAERTITTGDWQEARDAYDRLNALVASA